MPSLHAGEVPKRTGRLLVGMAVVVALPACDLTSQGPDRVSMARELAPTVKSFQATGVYYVEADGEPAVALDSLHGPG